MNRLFTLVPVAWRQFARLQRIQNAQNLLRIAADRQVRHVDEANDSLGVNDEGSALADSRLGV